MARINIEECWWIDPRRSKLIRLLGSESTADGEAVKMWRLAQEYWKNGRGFVPKEIFESLEVSSKLIEAGLAKLEGDFVYVKGSSQHLDWVYDQKAKQSAGGKKSAETRKRKFGSAQPPKKPAKPRSKIEVESKLLEVSGSGSLSGSGSDSEIPVSSKQTKAGAFIVGYKNRFFFAYGSKANVEGKDAGIAKRVAERLSFEEIEIYLEAFFQMPDAELKKKKHPVFLFENKINEIAVFAQSGEFTTMREAQMADNAISISSQLQRIRDGKI